MANMIDLECKCNFFKYSNFETHTSNVSSVLKMMASSFSPVPNSPVNIEPSPINENWPRFNIISDLNFTVNSPLSRVSCLKLISSLRV